MWHRGDSSGERRAAPNDALYVFCARHLGGVNGESVAIRWDSCLPVDLHCVYITLRIIGIAKDEPLVYEINETVRYNEHIYYEFEFSALVEKLFCSHSILSIL